MSSCREPIMGARMLTKTVYLKTTKTIYCVKWWQRLFSATHCLDTVSGEPKHPGNILKRSKLKTFMPPTIVMVTPTYLFFLSLYLPVPQKCGMRYTHPK